jgi:hypothetical protein
MIQRYSIYGSCYDKGEWVRFRDHQQALSALEEQKIAARDTIKEVLQIEILDEAEDTLQSALLALRQKWQIRDEWEQYAMERVMQLQATLTAAQARIAELEKELRKEWCLNHGHSVTDIYGDDGELQCARCMREYPGCWDFKRMDINALREHVQFSRLAAARAALGVNTKRD